MTDYTLYYWPIPFRGQFVRAVLAHVGASWGEASMDEIFELKDAGPAQQPVPHMGPPVLIDHAAGISLSQLPAILSYLGRKHDLLPASNIGEALTDKIVADANDVLYEMTLHNGAQVWSREKWTDYQPRLNRWMQIFEETGRRHGLLLDQGFMLGTEEASIADFTAYVLWDTMTRKLPALRPILVEQAPAVAGLCERIGALSAQAELRSRCDEAYGDEWCSGQIEASLRAVL